MTVAVILIILEVMKVNKMLIVGLGNPEGKYFKTYHNVGFNAVEIVAEKLDTEFKKKGNQLMAKVDNVLILKPLTYMNLSGQAVVAVTRKHKIKPENVIVLYDDLYIDKGHIRISYGGSGGGHNGIRSINELLGTNQYTKIRIGIKPTKEPHCTKKYVLEKIDADSRILIEPAINDAVNCAIAMINGEPIETLQQKYNTRNVND